MAGKILIIPATTIMAGDGHAHFVRMPYATQINLSDFLCPAHYRSGASRREQPLSRLRHCCCLISAMDGFFPAVENFDKILCSKLHRKRRDDEENS